MERLFAENDIYPRIVMEMPSNETIKQTVMAGMGLSFLSLRTIRHELASGPLVLLDVLGLPLVPRNACRRRPGSSSRSLLKKPGR
jgi:DNA-binding transcriptional LysR family regulator